MSCVRVQSHQQTSDESSFEVVQGEVHTAELPKDATESLLPDDTSHVQSGYQEQTDGEPLSKSTSTKLDTDGGKDGVKPYIDPAGATHFQRLVARLWLVEWLSWFLAFAAVGGIVGVLAAFDGQPIPDWPYGITLGALVSLLATIAATCLAQPIAVCTGQAKWIWFTRKQRMADFGLIDDASRGALGSAKLLISGKKGILAFFGATLTITMLAVNPFVQQVVQFETRWQNSTAAAVPIALTYNTYDQPGISILSTDVDLTMKAAIQRGMLDISANTSTFFPSPQCATGNCTWNPYVSLAVCSQCADISGKLSTNGSEFMTTTYLPNNVSIDSDDSVVGQGFIAMTVNTTIPGDNSRYTTYDSVAFSDADLTLLDVFTIIPKYGDSNDVAVYGPYASECVLRFCVQNLSSSATNGIFSENPTDQLHRYINDSTLQLTVGAHNYTVNSATMNGFKQYLAGMFNTAVHQTNGLSPINEWPDSVSQSLFYWTNGTQDHMPTNMFENLAASISSTIRSTSNESSAGTASALQTRVAIKWPWMILPFLLLALVGVYLPAVIFITDRKQLQPWKNSSLALLMHGLADEESRSLVADAEGFLFEMEHVAHALSMSMVRNGAAAGSSDEGGDAQAFHTGLGVRQVVLQSE